MLEFKKLNLEDIPLLKPYFPFQKGRNCDATVGGAFMWRDFFLTHFAIRDSVLYSKVVYLNQEEAFTVPLGGDISCVDHIAAYCKANGKEMILCSVTKNDLEQIKRRYPIREIRPERDWFDYLYLAKDLAELKGKRYHGQKNHINKFQSLYPDYQFREIDDSNIGEILDFYKTFLLGYQKENAIAVEEKEKTLEVLENMAMYQMIGGALYIDRKAVAFSLGEKMNDVLYVHIEKADTQYKGIYATLVNQFVKRYAGGEILFVNREEDVGDPGLRTSKLSYHPIELIEKYTIKIGEPASDHEN